MEKNRLFKENLLEMYHDREDNTDNDKKTEFG